MKRRWTLLAVLAALLCAFAFASGGTASAHAQTKPSGGTLTEALSNVPVTSATSGAGVLNGTLTVTHFVSQGGHLYAVSDITGTITYANNATQQLAVSNALVPVGDPAGSCTILDLTLGPLHLDLLGLVIDLSQVHLVITAQQGSGNLLGNLLCAVAHLLDNTNASTNAIANLLNHILALL